MLLLFQEITIVREPAKIHEKAYLYSPKYKLKKTIMALTFALIQERKNPPDKRVVFSPEKCVEIQEKYPEASILVEPSPIRVFSDTAYSNKGINVTTSLENATVMLGVKEVPVEALIPNKKYFFFSHTIKKQPYNRKLLRAVLEKNIELYDHETIITERGSRLIGFGRYAGIVGAYNGVRALGLRDKLFVLPKAESLPDYKAMKDALDLIKLPAIKIVLTGSGKVAYGAKEILDQLQIPRVTVEEYLNKTFDTPVYCLIDVLDYNCKKDGSVGTKKEFYTDPSSYKSDFMRFAKVSQFFIAGHFYGDGAPFLFTREDAKSEEFAINLVADISCDIDGPVASTIRPSTIAEPFYGYNPHTEAEVPYNDAKAITVMAVDNLPCELPKDASEGFGDMFFEHVIPAFFDGDANGILERAKMTTQEGTLTPRYSYLQDYVDGNE